MEYTLGMILGFLLLCTKAGSYYYLTGAQHQWPTGRLIWSFVITLPLIASNYWLAVIPLTIIIYFMFIIPSEEKEIGIRDWIGDSNVRKGIVDLIAGYLGMHVLAAFGGSIIAMIAMTTYTITCMAMIASTSLLKPKRRRRYVGP